MLLPTGVMVVVWVLLTRAASGVRALLLADAISGVRALLLADVISGVRALLPVDEAFGVRVSGVWAMLPNGAATKTSVLLPIGATVGASVSCDPKARNENWCSRFTTPVSSPKVAPTFAQYCQAITKKMVWKSLKPLPMAIVVCLVVVGLQARFTNDEE